MILTRKQEEGLKIAVERHRAHEKYKAREKEEYIGC